MKKVTIFLAFLLFVGFTVQAQVQISGTVTGAEDGLSIPGVSVVVKDNSTIGTTTDMDGKYSLTVPSEAEALVFSFVGMKSQEVAIVGQTVIDVALETGTIGLDEIVVVGYGTQDQKRIVQNVVVVDEQELENIVAVTPQEMLQGQASGVQMTQSSGILGSSNVIKVRGTGSLIAGASPLIVIDGVPMNDGNDFAYTRTQGANVGLNALADINPDDIATFTILKDASATAIYGSRGSNGVILITTKKGSINQDAVITVDMSSQWSQATDLIDMMSGDEYREYNVAIDNAFGIPSTVDDYPEGNFDWPTNVTQTGLSKNLSVSARGGTEKTKYYLGTSYTDQEGFIIGNALERIGVRINLDTRVKKWMKVGINISSSQSTNDRVGAENSTFAPLTTSYLQYPWVEPTDDDGNYVNTGFLANVIAIEDLDLDEVVSKRTYGNTYAKFDLLEGLSFKTDFGVDMVNIQETERSYEINSPGGYGANRVVDETKWVLTNTLDYNKVIGNAHTISVLAGMSYEESMLNRTFVEGITFPMDGLRNVGSAAEPTSTDHLRNAWSLYSWFSRLGYNYLGKYTFEGSLRRDGSSRFGSEKQYGVFWSVAGGWLMSDESFMQGIDFLNNLKLTASYGISGNDRIGYYPSYGLYTSAGTVASGDGTYNGNSGLVPQQAANPQLAWEESATLDIGIRSSWLNNRIEFNANYFIKNIDKLILDQPIPELTGVPASSVVLNVGEMKNSGWEFDLSTVNVQGDDFEWITRFNISFIDNEIISLPGADEDLQGRKFIAGTGQQRAVEGNDANSFYLIRYKGINPETGDAEWYDIDGNVTTTPTANDRVIAGSATPDFYGGMTNRLSYKIIDFSFQFNYSYGNDIYVSGYRFTDNPTAPYNVSTRMFDYWQQASDDAYAPAFTSSTWGSYNQHSTLFMRDASYLRLKNVTLAINLPDNTLERVGFLKGAQIYFTANNLLTFKSDELEGIDPEVTDDTNPLAQGETFFTPPQSKTYLVGLKFKF